MSTVIPIEKISTPFRNAYRNEGGHQYYHLVPDDHIKYMEKENSVKVNRVLHEGIGTSWIETVSLEFATDSDLVMFLLKWS